MCNIGHFDCEVDVKYLNDTCVKKETIKPQVGLWDESIEDNYCIRPRRDVPFFFYLLHIIFT